MCNRIAKVGVVYARLHPVSRGVFAECAAHVIRFQSRSVDYILYMSLVTSVKCCSQYLHVHVWIVDLHVCMFNSLIYLVSNPYLST